MLLLKYSEYCCFCITENYIILHLIFVYFLVAINISITEEDSDGDYYLDSDYAVENNSNTMNLDQDPLILPNPESLESRYTIDVLPNIEIPEDSLADSDLKDHDFIDNIMYVYYGSHSRNVGTYGKEIIIIGSVLSCAAQLLTIFCVMLKKNQRGEKIMTYIFFQIMGTFCISNLIFMLGVYVSNIIS